MSPKSRIRRSGKAGTADDQLEQAAGSLLLAAYLHPSDRSHFTMSATVLFYLNPDQLWEPVCHC